MLNKILDKPIYFSFDKTGYERHAKQFDKIKPESLEVEFRPYLLIWER